MRLFVVGLGQGGSMVAEQFSVMAEDVWDNRRVRILAGKRENKQMRVKADPINYGVLLINSAKADLEGIRHVPDDVRNRLQLGSETGHEGHGAGKDNLIGKKLVEDAKERILERIRRDERVAESEAILVIASTAGGTGSGSIGVVVNWLKQNFAKPVYAMLLLPFKSECDNRLAIENTAACLTKVLGEMEKKVTIDGEETEGADAVILVNNQSFARRNSGEGYSTDFINRKVAHSFRDVLCANEEQSPRYASKKTLDAQDTMNAITGVTVVGHSETPISKGRGLLRSRHYLAVENMIAEGRKELVKAFENLSTDCEEKREQGELFFKAEKALCLFSAPPDEASYEMVKTMEGYFAEHVPGAGLWNGVYIGGPKDSIGFTVILSRVGAGEVTKTVQWFLDRGVVVQDEVKDDEKQTDSDWQGTLKVSDKLRKKL